MATGKDKQPSRAVQGSEEVANPNAISVKDVDNDKITMLTNTTTMSMKLTLCLVAGGADVEPGTAGQGLAGRQRAV